MSDLIASGLIYDPLPFVTHSCIGDFAYTVKNKGNLQYCVGDY
jgi:hypothetical protein